MRILASGILWRPASDVRRPVCSRRFDLVQAVRWPCAYAKPVGDCSLVENLVVRRHGPRTVFISKSLRKERHAERRDVARRDSTTRALSIYAKGEIGREEYLRRKTDSKGA